MLVDSDYITDSAEFVAAMRSHDVPDDVIEGVLRDATRYQVLQVNACNRELHPHEVAREEHIEARTFGRLAAYGIETEFQGDPRGATIKVRFADRKPSNWWGGDGWYVVPTEYV